jgi:CBS domain containing-hemolysin-like protein
MVKDVMTPRSVMKIASENQSIQSYFDENTKLRFSRIPVYSDKEDHISGFVLKDNILEELVRNNGEMLLSEIRRDLIITERNTPIPELFNLLITKREHVALVVDEFGSVSGLVSMEDVIETLLGLEIMDENDNVADLQQLARKNWEVRTEQAGIVEKNDNKE